MEAYDSFQIEKEIIIDAPRSKVFDALTTHVDHWWAYRLCGTDSTLVFEREVGGKFFEKGRESEALWGLVTYIRTAQEIHLSGSLGMRGAISSGYSFRLEDNGENSTLLTLSHHALGLMNPEWGTMFEEEWDELLGKYLKEYVEEGKRLENK